MELDFLFGILTTFTAIVCGIFIFYLSLNVENMCILVTVLLFVRAVELMR